jgi:hypothetical protein
MKKTEYRDRIIKGLPQYKERKERNNKNKMRKGRERNIGKKRKE